MGKFDLLKFAFKYFYPRYHMEYDDVQYNSVEEDYEEWMNSIYTNGAWYIGESDDTIVTQTRTRSIPLDYAYILDGGNRLYFCTKIDGFGKRQKIPIKVEYVLEDESMFFETQDIIYKNNYLKIPLDENITFDNIKSVMVKSISSVIENYISYTAVGSKSFQKSRLVLISGDEFNLVVDSDRVVQKLGSVPKIIRYSVVESNRKVYGFRLKDFEPFLYDGGQEIDFHIKSYKMIYEDSDGEGNVSSECVLTSDYHMVDTLANFDGVVEEALYLHDLEHHGHFDKLELDVVVSARGVYSGLGVHLVFDVVQGNAYNDASVVEYL